MQFEKMGYLENVVDSVVGKVIKYTKLHQVLYPSCARDSGEICKNSMILLSSMIEINFTFSVVHIFIRKRNYYGLYILGKL